MLRAGHQPFTAPLLITIDPTRNALCRQKNDVFKKVEETPDLLETGALSGLSYDGPVRAVSEPHAVSTA